MSARPKARSRILTPWRRSKNFADRVEEVRAKLAPGTPVEVGPGQMRVGQKNKLIYGWARKGLVPEPRMIGEP